MGKAVGIGCAAVVALGGICFFLSVVVGSYQAATAARAPTESTQAHDGILVSSVKKGPEARKIDLVIHNNYAVSIFSVTAVLKAPKGVKIEPLPGEIPLGGKTAIAASERVEGHDERRFRWALTMNPKAEIAIEVVAISMGERHVFRGTVESPKDWEKTLIVTYDFDLATAQFTAAFRWGES